MKQLLRISLLLQCVVCFLSACADPNSTVVYHSFRSFPHGEWTKGDTVCFQYADSDALPTTYRLFIELRNNSRYPYSDLQLLVHENFLDTARFHTDTIMVKIADSTGRWLGKGWGALYQTEQFIKTVRVTSPATYSLKITGGMQDDQLIGINDIGIRIEKSKRN